MTAFPAKAFAKALAQTGIPLSDTEQDSITQTARFLHRATELIRQVTAADATN